MSELRVVSIQIKDVLGAREFALAPGKITQLRGKNGSGKSTALAAVQAALAGGNLAKLARVDKSGEPVEPEVVLVIDGPGAERYRVERKGDKIRVRQRVGETAAFEDVGKPQTWLRSLYDPQGANPVTFLMAADKDRALLLLEALPLKMDRAALLAEMEIRADELPAIPAGLHPLEEVAMIREAVFRTRTGVNTNQKGKAQAADQVRRSAPAVIPEDPGGEAQAALETKAVELAQDITREDEQATAAEEAAIATARHAFEQAEAGVVGSFKTAASKLRAEHERVAADMRADVERQIADRAKKLETAIEEVRAKGEETIGQAEAQRDGLVAAAAKARAAARTALDARRIQLATTRERLAGLRGQREAAAAAQALHNQAKRFDEEAEQLKAESTRLTLAIDKLDAFRRRMASDLPIAGLEIEGREIRVNGVPYEQLNTAQRVDIAVQVACLRSRDQRLPVVFVDGAEALDSEHFDILVERLRTAGVQAFLGRVEDSELRVVTDEAVGAGA